MSRLKEIRKARNYTQCELAKAAGCSQEMISFAEKGGTMSVAMARRIGKVLQCEWWMLFDEQVEE